MDTRWAIAHSPKLLQSILAGMCDYYTVGIALQAFGTATAGWTLLFQAASWFNFYCLVRPYSNSAEAFLVTAALFYWMPCLVSVTRESTKRHDTGAREHGQEHSSGTDRCRVLPTRGSENVALLLASVSIAVRPTSAALWVAAGLFRLFTMPLRLWPKYLFFTVLPPVATVIGASFVIDAWLYGSSTIVPLNFVRFNVLEGKSRIFGEQPFHWNFSEGLPAVLGCALPPAVWGFARAGGGGNRVLGWFAIWFLVYHSLSPHKEFRFLLPVLPVSHVYAGRAVWAHLAGVGKKIEQEDETRQRLRSSDSAHGSCLSQGVASASRRVRRLRLAIVSTVIILHVPTALYLSVWHQGGTLSAVDVVARKVSALAAALHEQGGVGERLQTADAREGRHLNQKEVDLSVAVHFLMPCHSAPLYSHLHVPVVQMDLWSLDCSPENRALPDGSESDQFLANPLRFLTQTYVENSDKIMTNPLGTQQAAPDFAIIYETHFHRPGVESFLARTLQLEVIETVFNAHVNGDADSNDTYRSVVVLEQRCRTTGVEP